MASSAHHPETPAERLISFTIEWTWLLWLVGGLYIAGPALGWTLGAMAALALYLGRAQHSAPGPVIVWLTGMLAMLLILWVGHANFDLGTGQTIKSSIGWAKGWALIALFPLAGAILPVRLEVIYRAICRLGLYTLLILPILLAAPFIGLPELLWVSPLSVIGGSGPEYFAVQLYTIEPGVGSARWQFFAPWSPAAGMIGVIYVLLAWREKHPGWRAVGVAGGLALAIFSQSRLALVCLAAIAPIVWSAGRMDRDWLWLLAAPVVLLLGLFGPTLIDLADTAMTEFSAARADSSRVRAALGRIAIDRWQAEAFWFGHGIVENGPHLVEFMPIGSHHSWYGLLFVKGLLGVIALAVPLGVTLIALLGKARRSRSVRTGLAMTLVLLLYSFGENLEILAYLYWPALVVMGASLRSDRAASPDAPGGAR